MTYAEILVHHSFLLGQYKQSYEWRGAKNVPVIVPRSVLREFDQGREWPDRINLDGLPPLRYLPDSDRYEGMFIRNAALYVRVDGSGLFSWAYWAVRSRVLRSFWLAYERSILTLHVWGLASYEPSRRPSWRDIYMFQISKARRGGALSK